MPCGGLLSGTLAAAASRSKRLATALRAAASSRGSALQARVKGRTTFSTSATNSDMTLFVSGEPNACSPVVQRPRGSRARAGQLVNARGLVGQELPVARDAKPLPPDLPALDGPLVSNLVPGNRLAPFTCHSLRALSFVGRLGRLDGPPVFRRLHSVVRDLHSSLPLVRWIVQRPEGRHFTTPGAENLENGSRGTPWRRDVSWA